jgi:hypothetical protein
MGYCYERQQGFACAAGVMTASRCGCFGWLPMDTGYFHKCPTGLTDPPAAVGCTCAYELDGRSSMNLKRRGRNSGWIILGPAHKQKSTGLAQNFQVDPAV